MILVDALVLIINYCASGIYIVCLVENKGSSILVVLWFCTAFRQEMFTNYFRMSRRAKFHEMVLEFWGCTAVNKGAFKKLVTPFSPIGGCKKSRPRIDRYADCRNVGIFLTPRFNVLTLTPAAP